MCNNDLMLVLPLFLSNAAKFGCEGQRLICQLILFKAIFFMLSYVSYDQSMQTQGVECRQPVHTFKSE